MGGTSSTMNPVMDPAAPIKVGEHDMPTFNDAHFAKIRAFYGVPADFIDASFSFALKAQGGNMSEGGGKGGNLMGFTADRGYIIKELNKTDHATLLSVAADYAEHMCHEDGTLLCRILAHFYHPERKPRIGTVRSMPSINLLCLCDPRRSNYMIMNNVIPPPPQAKGTLTTSGPGGESTTSLAAKRRASYDLKGCNDDKVLEQNGERLAEVHKRIWQVHMWCGSCCWSRERKAYYDGKRQAFKEQFHVTSAQKDDLMQWLRTAVHFLSERSLMDYSLMVSVLKLDANDPATPAAIAAIEAQRSASKHGASGTSPLPFVSVGPDGCVHVVYVGIIDYLQDWTCTKNLAMAVKVCERNKATVPPPEYGARFIRHFTDNFVGDSAAYSDAAPKAATIAHA